MKSRLTLTLLLMSALLVPVAIASAAPDKSVVVAKKKKLSYCAKQAKKNKAKLKASVKSAKFFLYTKKRPTEYFFCSESPKFTGFIASWEGIKTTSHLRAVRNNCAVFYTETPPGTSRDAGVKSLKVISARFFRRGAVKQTHASQLGSKEEAVTLQQVALSSNCIYAAAYKVNGVSTLTVGGAGNLLFSGRVKRAIPTASDAELKNVKVVATGATTAQVQWTEGGVAKSLDYTGSTN